SFRQHLSALVAEFGYPAATFCSAFFALLDYRQLFSAFRAVYVFERRDGTASFALLLWLCDQAVARYHHSFVFNTEFARRAEITDRQNHFSGRVFLAGIIKIFC